MAAEDRLSLQRFVCNLLNSVPGKQRNTWELEEYINSTPFPIEHKLNMEIFENHFDGFVASFCIVLKVCLKLCICSTTTCLCILLACVVAAEQQWQKMDPEMSPKTVSCCLFYEFISKCKLHYSMHTSYDNVHYPTICYFSYLHRTWSQYIV